MNNNSTSKIGGAISLFLGIIGCAYAAIVISDDKSKWFGYNYQSPLTSHEITMITIAIIGAVCVLVGIIILAGGSTGEPQGNAYSSLSNRNNDGPVLQPIQYGLIAKCDFCGRELVVDEWKVISRNGVYTKAICKDCLSRQVYRGL